jgi:hypothetical protein
MAEMTVWGRPFLVVRLKMYMKVISLNIPNLKTVLSTLNQGRGYAPNNLKNKNRWKIK